MVGLVLVKMLFVMRMLRKIEGKKMLLFEKIKICLLVFKLVFCRFRVIFFERSWQLLRVMQLLLGFLGLMNDFVFVRGLVVELKIYFCRELCGILIVYFELIIILGGYWLVMGWSLSNKRRRRMVKGMVRRMEGELNVNMYKC